MAAFSAGDLVVSLCGHDKGEFFIVLSTDKNFVTICDGKRRKVAKAKKKKDKHIRATGLNTNLINNVPTYAVDANVRREIKRLKEFV